MGNNIEALSRLLEAEGIGAAVETIRGWEAGARPSDDAIRAMERIFGDKAPELPPESALVAAAIDRLTAAVQAQTQALLHRQDVFERWARGLATGLGDAAAEPTGDPTLPPRAALPR